MNPGEQRTHKTALTDLAVELKLTTEAWDLEFTALRDRVEALDAATLAQVRALLRTLSDIQRELSTIGQDSQRESLRLDAAFGLENRDFLGRVRWFFGIG